MRYAHPRGPLDLCLFEPEADARKFRDGMQPPLVSVVGPVGREGIPMTEYKFCLVHCHECGVTSPREPAELARQSGRYCLICGEKFEQDAQVGEQTDVQQKPSAR